MNDHAKARLRRAAELVREAETNLTAALKFTDDVGTRDKLEHALALINDGLIDLMSDIEPA